MDEELKPCPFCGEALTEPKPLTLDEVKKRVGRPVWVQDLLISECSEWHIVVDDVGSIRLYGHLSIPNGNVGYNASTGRGYGETWLAYDSQPRGESNVGSGKA